MSGQQFNTVDQLRLEVEADPPADVLPNLIRNPSGELGAWGWITPVNNTVMLATEAAGTHWLKFTTLAGGQAAWFLSEPGRVTAGEYVSSRFETAATGGAGGGGAITARARFVFLADDGAEVSQGPQTVAFNAAGTIQLAAAQVPAGAEYVQLRIDLYQTTSPGSYPPAGAYLQLREVMLATAPTTAKFGSTRTNLYAYPSFEGSFASVLPEGAGLAVYRFNGLAAHGGYVMAVQRASTAGVLGVLMPPSALAVTPGLPYALQIKARAIDAGLYAGTLRLFASFYRADGSKHSEQQLAEVASSNVHQLLAGVAVAPTGVASMTLIVRDTNAAVPANRGYYFDQVMIEQTDTVKAWFDGSLPDAGGKTYDWTGIVNGSTSIETTLAELPFVPTQWLGVLGTAHQVTTSRAPLDAGVLTGQLRDATLDPAVDESLRPGRRCQLLTTAGEPVFTGTLRRASVVYELRQPKAEKRARVTFEATDPADALANAPRSEGVATIDELPHVLEGAGVPWKVNGSINQVAAPVVVATNDNASALDQLALTRDSALGHVWIDRHGVVQAWDETALLYDIKATLDEASYSDLAIDYDTDRAINVVTVKFLRTDPGDGSTQEVVYGPFRDDDSVREFGARAETFTIQWQNEDPAAIESYALAILAANATPAIRVNEATLPIRTTDDLDQLATLDLLDLVIVNNAEAGIGSLLRVQGITHTISARRWTMTLQFSRDGQVATPQYTPSPSGGAGGLTLSELLRPIGEVTMLFGTQAQIPLGWLELNGASYSVTDYPKLADYLAVADPSLPAGVLPDWNDRYLIGASGSKAVGAAGGSPSTPLPNHKHRGAAHDHGTATIVQTKATNTATGGGGTRVTDISGMTGTAGTGIGENPETNPAIDTMPPWRAIRLIIRAR